MNPRMIILETLLVIDSDVSLGYTAIAQVLDKYSYLDKRDRSFIKRTLEGCVERRIELDYIIDSKSRTKVKDMKPVIRAIMRMSVYQLKYMDSVPESAVCNEAVKLAVKKGFSGLKGFVNGVLRSIARDIGNIEYPDPGSATGMSVRYSCPVWLVEQFVAELGAERAAKVLEASLKPSDVCIRINLSGIPVAEYAKMLDDKGVRYEIPDHPACAIRLKDIDNVTDLPGYEEGLFQVQDIGSMLVALSAGIAYGDTVFDVCAAPGGKSMHVLDILNGTGHLYSFDVSERKLALIRENAGRMGFDNIDIRLADAAVYVPEYEGMADVLIADLPCSGLGVMGRKNDIKYNITPEREGSLVKLQREILSNVSRYVKPGGTLVFSTCTIHREENEENVKWIEENLPFKAVSLDGCIPDALICRTSGKGYIQLIPGVHDCDGFFISKFEKKQC